MIFGPPGEGKTRLIGSGGKGTLILRPPTDHTDSVDNDDFEEIVLQDWAGMLDVYQWLHQGGHKEVDWVWLDSISLMQDFLLADVMADAMARRPDRGMGLKDGKLVKGESQGLVVPEFGPDQGEFKINFERIALWVAKMVALCEEGKIRFGMTAHPFEWYNPLRKEDVWAPWIQGKNMSPKISGYMNIVAFLERQGESTRLYTQADGFFGKDDRHRFPALKSGKRGLAPKEREITMEDLNKVLKGRAGRAPQKRRASSSRPRRSKRGNK
jgi:hypothetical protein